MLGIKTKNRPNQNPPIPKQQMYKKITYVFYRKNQNMSIVCFLKINDIN